MKYKIAILGASGKTGSKILQYFMAKNNCEFEITYAVVSKLNNKLDQDISVLLGGEECGIKFCCDWQSAVENSEIIIDFSSHELTNLLLDNNNNFLKNKKIIIGTTPFNYENFLIYKKNILENNFVFYSPNMSILVNILAEFIGKFKYFFNDNYDIAIHDIHHIHKKDSPSGTALFLKNKLNIEGQENLVQTTSSRLSEIFAINQLYFASPNEFLEIKHQVLNRDLFAEGVFKIIKWITNEKNFNKKGFFEIKDFINDLN